MGKLPYHCLHITMSEMKLCLYVSGKARRNLHNGVQAVRERFDFHNQS